MAVSKNHNIDIENTALTDSQLLVMCHQLIAQGKFAEAFLLLDHLCQQGYKYASCASLKIACLINTYRYSEAALALEELKSKCPKDKNALRLAPLVYSGVGDYASAYQASLLLSHEQRKDPSVRKAINISLQHISSLSNNTYLDDDLIELMRDSSASRNRTLVRLAEVMIRRYGLRESSIRIDLEGMASDKVLCEYLKYSFVVSPELENLLTQARRVILTQSLAAMNLPDEIMPLVVGLAQQNWLNEYIHYVEQDERVLIDELETLLQEHVTSSGGRVSDVEGLLLLLLLYKPLESLACHEVLKKVNIESWPVSLKLLARETLFDSQKDLQYSLKVKSIGDISDDVSRQVRLQYEENPYPRWNSLPVPERKNSYYQAIRSLLDAGDKLLDSVSCDEQIDVLVAGCGTGRQPLEIAANFNVNITAIDITLRSLGYAQMMAEKLNITGIDFLHMDILELQRLGKSYDVVESMGVLHHMASPEKGLESIVGVVKPGGLIKLGLYSSTARKAVSAVRKIYAESDLEPTAENIRSVRRALLDSSAKDEFKGIELFGDIYAMSPCRDLLFHVQEHSYDLLQVRDLLELFNLEFLGFTFADGSVNSAFDQCYGRESRRDLGAWHTFEESNPRTFESMYQFFVRVPAR
ncbi:class I SAM-dependent methyltransferase [Maricurvus nonylphenolicus]|uniref:class I SAM-dependent methyltransferase n=1 Tax=Maricurvus nonylphenolicus TaxID=1008307 RepID=UPI0036F1AB5E